MRTPSSLRSVALLLMVVGLLVEAVSLAALLATRVQSWRFGVAVGGLVVFVGCCLWHAARRTEGA